VHTACWERNGQKFVFGLRSISGRARRRYRLRVVESAVSCSEKRINILFGMLRRGPNVGGWVVSSPPDLLLERPRQQHLELPVPGHKLPHCTQGGGRTQGHVHLHTHRQHATHSTLSHAAAVQEDAVTTPNLVCTRPALQHTAHPTNTTA
jgi:hypothetical protein